MEFDILHLHRLASCSATRCLKHNLVVQPQSKLRHSTQIALHLNGTQDLRSQDISGSGDEEIQGFDDIEEDFVLAVADSFASPRDGVGDGNRGSCLDFKLVRFLGNIPVEQISTRPVLPPFVRVRVRAYSCNILLSVVCG